MIRFRERSASSSRILAALSCGVFIASPAYAQLGQSDWQTPSGNSAPEANWGSNPPGSFLQQGKTPVKKTSSTSKTSASPPLRTDDFSNDFSSKGQGLSGWQSNGGGSGSSSGSSSGSQGLSGWQSSGGGSGSSDGSQGLSGWQSSGGGSASSGVPSGSSGSSGLSGWQSGGGGNSSAGGGSQGLSGWQSGGAGGSNATLGDVLQQEQSMGGNSTQLQGGVERDRNVNNGGAGTMGGGMAGGLNGMGGANQMGGTGGNPMGGVGGLGGLGGALGGMGGAGLMDVLMNILPKRPAPGATTAGTQPGNTYFGTRSHGPNMFTGVPKTVNRAVNRNLKRAINVGANRATNNMLRHIRF